MSHPDSLQRVSIDFYKKLTKSLLSSEKMRLSLLATIGSAMSGPVVTTNSTLNVTDVSTTVTISVTETPTEPFVTNSSTTFAPSFNPTTSPEFTPGGFDLGSFFGGAVLTVGITGTAYFGVKFYKANNPDYRHI